MTDALERSVPIAIVGAGAMGTGIAQIAALAGHRTIILDADRARAEGAVSTIRRTLQAQVDKGRLDAVDAAAAGGRLEAASDHRAIAPAGLIIEAVTEDLAVKIAVIQSIEAAVAPESIIATNTSSLSIAAMGLAMTRPQRLCGIHFFNPAPLMPLVEVVSAPATAADVATRAFATMRRWGKTPIHTRSSPAFVVNRCARAFYSEAWRLVAERAADAATIDAVMREAGGFRMGPCELIDLIGQDINFATTTTVREAFFGEPRYRQSPFQKEMIEAGHLGRKTGRGFYDYGPGAARPLPATEPSAPAPRRVFAAGDIGLAQPLVARARLAGLDVEATTETASGPAFVVDGVVVAASDGRPATLRTGVSVVFDLARNYETAARIAIAVADDASPAAVAAAAGFFQALGMSVSRIDDTPGLIVMRTIAMLANEALDAAQQGIASEDDIDMAMMKGVNYPIGPIAWAREIGFGHMLAVIDHLQHLYGEDRYRASMRLRRRAAVEKRGRARN